MAGSRTVLLLGGSAEAVALARWLDGRADVRLIASLRGVTPSPVHLADDLVVGGFGGARRVAAFLRERDVDIVVDATHPFAVRIARNARRAALVAGLERLKLWRPAWTPEVGDCWHDAADPADAARLAGTLGRRPFVSLGAGGVRQFPVAGFERVTFRAIERPADLPPTAGFVAGRGPFALADEIALLRALATDVLVTKNAGGSATAPKLTAARTLGLPVVMIRRPPCPPPPLAASVAAARTWLEAALAEAARSDMVRPGFPGADRAKAARC